MKKGKLGLIKNKKGIILGTIITSMALSLTACGTKTDKVNDDEAVAQDIEVQSSGNDVEDNKPSDDKTTENNTNTNSNSNETTNKVEQNKQENNTNANTNTNNGGNANTNTNTNTNTSGGTTSSTQITDGLKDTTYTSNNLGITFNVPDSWKGKYNVIETDGKVSVYMKHKENNEGIGLLFIIKKQGVEEYQMLNSIDGIESVDVNGQTFTVGGPTGYSMNDGDPLIPTYNQMVGECVYPVSTIKAK